MCLGLKLAGVDYSARRVAVSSDDVLEALRNDSGHRVVYVFFESPREPEPGPPVEEVVKEEVLVKALKSRGIARLYRFQAEAIESIRSGNNTLIIAGTGTGKTEAFLVPILERLYREPEETGILVYPTKALARDQVERIYSYAGAVFGFRVSVYDGDTPEKEREMLQVYPPRLLVTNPDMLHLSLRRGEGVKPILEKAKFVVLDDAHIYSGVFGSHVHYVLKRMKRFMPADAVFVASSATIGNPREFSQKLFGEECRVVEAGLTRRAPVYHVMVRPAARSRMAEALRLLRILAERRLRTLLFVDSHKVAESLSVLAQREGLKVSVHRAGLLPSHRRSVEEKLRKGELDAVVTTPTLELGIDIGELDAVVLYGVPPTFSKYVQRAGRVGRRGRTGYVIMILGDDPISSYYERNPAEFFNQKPDPVFLDPLNEEVMRVHLVAMAQDAPFRLDSLGGAERKVCEKLLEEGLLRLAPGGFVEPTSRGLRFLASRDNIRGIGEQVKIVTDTGKVIGFREMPQAIKELYPGAIYIHGGTPYISLGIEGRKARVKLLPTSTIPVTTSPLYYTWPFENEVLDERSVFGIRVSYLELEVADHVYGYVTKSFPEGHVISQKILEEELTYRFKTKGLLLEMQPNPQWSELQNAEAFHAVEHALIYAGQLVVGAAPTDMGGISFPSGHIYIYDAFPGGSGVTKQLLERLEEALHKAFDIVSRCTCEDGCPKCIFSPYCGNNNRILSRRKASQVLGEVLSLRIAGRSPERYGKPLV